MPLATAATGIGIGKQVVTHAVRTWLGARRERAERDAELIDLVRISVRDHFQRRKLVRQLEDLADQIAERLRPVYEPPPPSNSGYLRRWEKTMMISSTAPVRNDRCLVPVSARFALSQAGLPTSEESPSGAETRPFALRFVRPPNRAMNDPLPPYRYCPVQQVLISDDDDDDEPVVWEPTTVGSKDGKENPQEDWKPDLPFHAES